MGTRRPGSNQDSYIQEERTTNKPAPNEQGKIYYYINNQRKSERSPVLKGYITIPLDMIAAAIDNAETIEYDGVVYLKLRANMFPQEVRKKNDKSPDYTGYINRYQPEQVDQDRQEVRAQFERNRGF